MSLEKQSFVFSNLAKHHRDTVAAQLREMAAMIDTSQMDYEGGGITFIAQRDPVSGKRALQMSSDVIFSVNTRHRDERRLRKQAGDFDDSFAEAMALMAARILRKSVQHDGGGMKIISTSGYTEFKGHLRFMLTRDTDIENSAVQSLVMKMAPEFKELLQFFRTCPDIHNDPEHHARYHQLLRKFNGVASAEQKTREEILRHVMENHPEVKALIDVLDETSFHPTSSGWTSDWPTRVEAALAPFIKAKAL